jgi:hypothetical protein
MAKKITYSRNILEFPTFSIFKKKEKGATEREREINRVSLISNIQYPTARRLPTIYFFLFLSPEIDDDDFASVDILSINSSKW